MSLWYPCVHCTEDLKCDKYSDQRTVSFCAFGLCEEQERSHGDEIRSMSDEDLAGMFAKVDTCPSPEYERNCDNRCVECWFRWLKGEAKK